MMNWKGRGKKQPYPILGYFSKILVKLRKTR